MPYNFPIAYNKKSEIFFYFIVLLLLAVSSYYLAVEVRFAALLYSLPFVIFYIFSFNKNIITYLIFSLFISYYIDATLRVQLVNLVSYSLMLYYILSNKSNRFNNYKLPFILLLTGILLVAVIFLSSNFTPHSSTLSKYYAFMFFTYIFTSYIVFRLVKNSENVERYLDLYFYILSFYSFIIIINIIATGNLRSYGISGPGIPDMLVCSLIIAFFKYFLIGRYNIRIIVPSVILLITLITTQSRFAWFGLALSIVYGLVLIFFKNRFVYIKITSSIVKIIFVSLIVLAAFFAFGVSDLIVDRFGDLDKSNVETFQSGTVAASNSFETRLMIWTVAVNAFQQNPVWGIGYFMFHKVSEKYNVWPEEIYFDYVYGLDPHSTLLSILVETGLIGFIVFISYFILIFYYSFKSINISKTDNEVLNSYVLNIIAFFIIVNSIYSGAFTYGHNAYLMHIMFGIIIGNYVYLKYKFNNEL